ncbi:hypothetical protein K3495_g9266 [Podosphaera aphanis]|nr:hypothetical protein K3495_g9266 [Podosphaera aphanis]
MDAVLGELRSGSPSKRVKVTRRYNVSQSTLNTLTTHKSAGDRDTKLYQAAHGALSSTNIIFYWEYVLKSMWVFALKIWVSRFNGRDGQEIDIEFLDNIDLS